MEIKNAIKTTIQAAGKNDKDISKFLNISAPAYSLFINGNLRQIERLVSIANFCGCKIVITDDKSINIEITNESSQ